MAIPHASVRVASPAKINLQLLVGPPRPDGFHGLHTVFHAVDLYDSVTARSTEPGAGISVHVATTEGSGKPAVDLADVPLGPGNLIWRAASLLAQTVGMEPDVQLELAKAIPVAAGLAGGSTDAAATLVACNQLWHAGLDRRELAELAAELGSDVPFGLIGGTAVGRGRGELLAPVLASGRFHWVLAIADGGLSTPDVYRELDRMRDSGAVPPAPDLAGGADDALLAAVRSGDARALGQVLHNDLQGPALRLAPYLKRTLDAGLNVGAVAGIVSGSGPTCMFLATDHAKAVQLAAALAAEGVCRTTRVVAGPVPGAHVVGSR